MSDWLTAEEAAEPLRTTAHQVTKMAKAGQFTKVKWVGNRVRIHKTEIYPVIPTATGATTDADRQSVQRLIDEITLRLNALYELVETPKPASSIAQLFPKEMHWGFTKQG